MVYLIVLLFNQKMFAKGFEAVMHPTALYGRNLLIKRSLVLAVLLLVSCFASSSYADLYCDPQIKSRSEQNRQNAIMKDIARFEGSYGQPNSFDSLYCGAQITSGFDQIGQSLVGGIAGQVNNLINQLFQRACRAAIAPIQNLASQTCVPNFTRNYFDTSFLNSIFGNQNRNNYCPGTQLIQVTPIIGGSGYSGGGYSSTPDLYW